MKEWACLWRKASAHCNNGGWPFTYNIKRLGPGTMIVQIREDRLIERERWGGGACQQVLMSAKLLYHIGLPAQVASGSLDSALRSRIPRG